MEQAFRGLWQGRLLHYRRRHRVTAARWHTAAGAAPARGVSAGAKSLAVVAVQFVPLRHKADMPTRSTYVRFWGKADLDQDGDNVAFLVSQ